MSEKTAETMDCRSENCSDNLIDPMTLLFRAYHVGENFDDICRMFQNALTAFRGCDRIQIQIEAPPRANPPAPRNRADGQSVDKNGQTRILGFAG